MEEKYIVSIVGQQIVNGSPDEVKLITLGSYNTRGNKKFISYYEYNDEDPSIKTKSTLTIEDNNLITLTKKGSSKSQLILEAGKRHLSQYDTEFGAMTIGVFTKHIDINLSPIGGSVFADYTIDINSHITSLNKIYVQIKEATQEDVKNHSEIER